MEGKDGMRMEGTGNLFGYEGWEITSGLERLGGDGVDVEITKEAPD